MALVDDQGRTRAQLGFSKEGPLGLWIMDEKGTARIALGLYPDGTSHFGLQDKNVDYPIDKIPRSKRSATLDF